MVGLLNGIDDIESDQELSFGMIFIFIDRCTVVTKHLQNIYSEVELHKNKSSEKIAHVQNEEQQNSD